MSGYLDAGVEITVVTARFGPVFDCGLSELLEDELDVRVLRCGLDLSGLEVAIARDSPQVAILSETAITSSSVPRRLRAIHPSIGLVALLHGLSEDEGRQLLSFGVNSCIAQDAAWSDISAAVRFAAEGKQMLVSSASGSKSLGGRGSATLTRREWEVIQLVRAGQSNPEIAQALQIGVETVRSHIQRLNRKLGIRRRSDLVTLQRSEWSG